MHGEGSMKNRLGTTDRFWVGVVILALLTFAIGYAGGSVLAGETISQQFWLVATVTALGAALLALFSGESDEQK